MMNPQQYSSAGKLQDRRYVAYQFFTETIEVSRMSALAFFEAGDQLYKGKRMFWQNRENTFTLVGLGHAHVMSTPNSHGRFEEIKSEWQSLCRQIVNEEHTVQPILFGGFSFDPLNKTQSVWTNFPQAYFAVPTYQLIIKGDQAFVSIHLITKEDDTFSEFDALRKERDRLIHSAQVSELKKYSKPMAIKLTEIEKERYLESIGKVTDIIKAKQAEKVVIARALKLQYDQPLSPAAALNQISEEQPESFLFGMEAQISFSLALAPNGL